MEIPYTVEPRPDTGLYNAKVGIWLFLASEVMLFGALFSSYILLRVGAAPGTWPQHLLNIPLGMVNTLVLICSSITVVLAWASLKMNQFGKYKFYQAITILCSLIFFCIKTVEYKYKFTHYYVKWSDGTEMNGHIKGSPLCWNLAKLNDPKNPIKEFEFHPDAEISKDGKTHGEHPAPITIATSNVKKLESFGPWHNTYLAIYFTLTALHGLHVIGGA